MEIMIQIKFQSLSSIKAKDQFGDAICNSQLKSKPDFLALNPSVSTTSLCALWRLPSLSMLQFSYLTDCNENSKYFTRLF